MLLEIYYKLKHPGEPVPYYYKRSIIGELLHLARKFVCQNIAPNCVTNFMRVTLYRLCGIKIGKGTFIGMKCYLDDLCHDKIVIEDNVIISYGVYFSCHGYHQDHNKIVIRRGAYIGMRASLIAPKGDIEIGEKAVIGANTLVNKSVPQGSTAVGVPCRIIPNQSLD
ncbi:MAG TPA: acyltransferase [Bacteroidales bacterium]|nr:acyltransferase [Bacteroidales bacterium]